MSKETKYRTEKAKYFPNEMKRFDKFNMNPTFLKFSVRKNHCGIFILNSLTNLNYHNILI